MARKKDMKSRKKATAKAGKKRARRCSSGKAASKKPAAPCPWFLYVAECADRTLYVGIAKNVEARLACHNAGRGAKYTRTRTPVRLVYSEKLADVGSALRREREVKRWSRPKKVAELSLASPPRLSPKPVRSPGRQSVPAA
jgi:putative endonuclease